LAVGAPSTAVKPRARREIIVDFMLSRWERASKLDRVSCEKKDQG